jgi:hypothetical protein
LLDRFPIFSRLPLLNQNPSFLGKFKIKLPGTFADNCNKTIGYVLPIGEIRKNVLTMGQEQDFVY